MSDKQFWRMLVGLPPKYKPTNANGTVRATNPLEQPRRTFSILSNEEIRLRTTIGDPSCAFTGMIGQERVIKQLLPILVAAFKNEHHDVPANALLLSGPPSTGKTQCARRIAGSKGLDIPYVETDRNQIKTTKDVFTLAKAAVEQSGVQLIQIGTKNGKPTFCLPNMCFFIDEIHDLEASTLNALLKSFEPQDRTLLTENEIVDCTNVLWVGATTDRGILAIKAPAFSSRMELIEFHGYSKIEVAKMIIQEYPRWLMGEAMAIAIRSGNVPRIAKVMAIQVDRYYDMLQLHDDKSSRMDAIEEVGKIYGVDEQGMSENQLAILESLTHRPTKGLSYAQTSRVTNKEATELKQFVLPALLSDNKDKKAAVYWTGQRMYILSRGIEELHKRKLIDDVQQQKLLAEIEE